MNDAIGVMARNTKGGWIGYLAVAWAYVGFFGLIGTAIVRIWGYVQPLRTYDWRPFEWMVLAVTLLGMLYAEGWKGFYLKLAPRFAARARFLRSNPTILRVLLAPFFCVGYFYAPRKRKIASYALTFGIILLVILVRKLDQPWRGIIDAGVVVGLGFGLASMAWTGLRLCLDPTWNPDPEVPTSPES